MNITIRLVKPPHFYVLQLTNRANGIRFGTNLAYYPAIDPSPTILSMDKK